MANAGVKFDPNLTEDRLSITFWTYALRSVPAQPRKVLKAAEFSCPPADQAGLDALEQKFIDGADVNAHLSNTRFRASGKHYNDGLFNDWGVQHFHLGLNGRRGNNCLFARVTRDTVYFLVVLPHLKYGEIEMVERIKSNWPHLIEHLRLEILPIDEPPDAEETMEARAAGIMSPTSSPTARSTARSAMGLRSEATHGRDLISRRVTG